MVWQSSGQDGSSYGIFGQRFDDNGSSLGSEFLVNRYTNDSQDHPCVSLLQSGGFVVLWKSQLEHGSYSGIYGRNFDADGNPTGLEFLINTYTTGYQLYPAVAVSSGGSLLVVWESWD